MRSTKAPTKAAPEAVSAAVKRAPACWEPTWFFSSGRSGRTTVASPTEISVISTSRWPAKGTACVIPLAIRSKSVIGAPYIHRVRVSRRIAMLFAASRSAAVELGVPGAALLEEGADGVLQVLGRKELRGFGPHRLVSGRDPAFAEAAEDALGH